MVKLKNSDPPPQVRWLIRRDMDQVLEIENRSFEFPWKEEEFLNCLRMRNCIGVVHASIDGMINGFMIYELQQRYLRILNMAVAPEVRRTGVCRQMMQRLIDKLSQQKRNSVEAEVRETNLRAQEMFASLGFHAVRVLRKHYDDTAEDAYLFRYSLSLSETASFADGGNRVSQYFENA